MTFMGRARQMFTRLTGFEQSVADRAADRLIREMASPERQRQASQERRRRELIDAGHSPTEAADLARSGQPQVPWVRQGGDGRDLSVSRRERSRMRRWTGYGP